MKQRPSLWFAVWLWQTFKHDIKLLYGALLHPDTPFKVKLAMAWIILYILSPIDIIPDRIVWAGILDDITVIIYWVKRIIRNIPKKVADEIDGKIIVMNKK